MTISAAGDGYLLHAADPLRIDMHRFLDGVARAAANDRSRVALLDHLNHSNDLLSDGARDLPVRHQSLHATLYWSYDLLTADEQAVLHTVAVFADGCTAAMVAAVVGVDETATLRLLAALLDASLVSRQPDGDEVRFTLLETVRTFALAQAEQAGVLDKLREQHALCVEGVVAAAREGMSGPVYGSWLARLRQEQDNVRVALRWLLDQGSLDRCAAILVLPQHWTFGGRTGEFLQWAREVLARDTGSLHRAGRAVNANVTMSLGRAEQAHRMLTELAAERRSGTATWDLGVTLAYQGLVLIRLGAWDQAERQVRAAVAMVNHFGGSITMMYVLHYLSVTAAHTGRPERAARLAGVIAAFYDELGPSMLGDNVAQLSQEVVDSVIGRLGRDRFDVLFREGRALTWDQAVRLAAGPASG